MQSGLVYLVIHIKNPYQLHRTITGYYDKMPSWHILGTIRAIIENPPPPKKMVCRLSQ